MRRHYKKIYKRKKRRSLFKSRIFWLSLLFLTAFASGVYLFLFSSVFQVRDIQVAADKKIYIDEIKDIVAREINRKIAFFDSKSIFLASTEEINKKIREKFPQIAEISFSKNFPSALAVEVKERVPIATWCQNDDCFYLDKDGVIYERCQEKKLPVITFNATLTEAKLGKILIEKDSLTKILDFNNALQQDFDFKVTGLIFSQEGEELTVKTNESWQIFFSTKNEAKNQIDNLSALLKEGIPPERRQDLEYINLKFGNKTYIKYKE